jgi:hypothetical protein
LEALLAAFPRDYGRAAEIRTLTTQGCGFSITKILPVLDNRLFLKCSKTLDVAGNKSKVVQNILSSLMDFSSNPRPLDFGEIIYSQQIHTLRDYRVLRARPWTYLYHVLVPCSLCKCTHVIGTSQRALEPKTSYCPLCMLLKRVKIGNVMNSDKWPQDNVHPPLDFPGLSQHCF